MCGNFNLGEKVRILKKLVSTDVKCLQPQSSFCEEVGTGPIDNSLKTLSL